MIFSFRKLLLLIIPIKQLYKKCCTVVTPGLLQKMSKKCNSTGEFSGLVVFLDVFFRKIGKKSQNVTVRESLLYRKPSHGLYIVRYKSPRTRAPLSGFYIGTTDSVDNSFYVFYPSNCPSG